MVHGRGHNLVEGVHEHIDNGTQVGKGLYHGSVSSAAALV
jgi:hypothetical protein